MSKKFVRDNTINGQCANCGRCCSSLLLLTESEVKRIKEHVKNNGIKPVNRNNILIDTKQVDVCPFLNESNLCNIYDERPEICRRFLCSEFCKEGKDTQNYTNVKAYDMMQTFFPEVKIAHPTDITLVNKMLEEKKKQLKRGRK